MGSRRTNAKKKMRRRAHAVKRKAADEAGASKGGVINERTRTGGAPARPAIGR